MQLCQQLPIIVPGANGSRCWRSNSWAFSLIADYFPREQLGKALSVYSAGIFVGAGMANIVGGTVSQAATRLPAMSVPMLGTVAPWRLTFLIVGAPGLLIGFLVYTVREPLRKNLLRRADGQIS